MQMAQLDEETVHCTIAKRQVMLFWGSQNGTRNQLREQSWRDVSNRISTFG